MLWVAAMYSCCTEHGRYGLCGICWSLSYAVKFYCC